MPSVSAVVKIISVVCVFLMLFTSINDLAQKSVPAQDRSGTDSIDSSDAWAKLLAQDPSRFTFSDSGAFNPSLSTTASGDCCLAWIDGHDGSQTIMFKKSSDDLATFSSDREVTPKFDKIRDVSLSSSAIGESIGIAFEGRSGEKDGVFFVFSVDGGSTWPSSYFVDEGTSPKLAMGPSSAIMSYSRMIDCELVLSLVEISFNARGAASAKLITSFKESGPYAVRAFDGTVEACWVAEVQRQIAFLRIDLRQGSMYGPFMISAVKDRVAAIDIVSSIRTPMIVWSESGKDSSYLKSAVEDSKVSSWKTSILLSAHEPIGQISTTSTPKGVFCIFGGGVGLRTIEGCLIDTANMTIGNRLTLAADIGPASGFDCTYGSSGEVLAIWSATVENRTDLYGTIDVMFVKPDIERLAAGVHKMIASSNDKSDSYWQLIIQSVDEAVNQSRVSYEEGLKAAMRNCDLLLRPFGDPNDPRWSTNQMVFVREKVQQYMCILAGVQMKPYCPLASLDGSRSWDPPPYQWHLDDGPNVESVFCSNATIAWTISNQSNPGSMHIQLWQNGSGSHGPSMAVAGQDIAGPYWRYEITVENLEPNTLYDYEIAENLQPDVGRGSLITTNFALSEVETIVDTPNACRIEWTMSDYEWPDHHGPPHDPEATVFYGLTTSYGHEATGYQDEHDYEKMSAVLPNLAPNATYHFKIAQQEELNDTLVSFTTQDFTIHENLTISDVSVSRTHNSCAISWSTSMDSTGILMYGEEFGNLTREATITDHDDPTAYVTEIDGLEQNHLYFYQINSTSDVDGRYFSSVTGRFWTGSMSIDNLTVESGADFLQFEWDTAANSSYVMIYGTSRSLYHHTTITSTVAETHHFARAENLTASHVYYYRVTCTDPYDNFTQEDVLSGDSSTISRALDTMHATLADRYANNTYKVLISWHTNYFGSTEVTYSRYSDFRSPKVVTGNNAWEHGVYVPYLSANLAWYFKARTTIPGGGVYIESGTISIDTRIYISSLAVSLLTPTSYQITWTTNQIATTTLLWGRTTQLNNTAEGALDTSHSITLSGLTYGATYYYQAMSNYTYQGYVFPASKPILHFTCGKVNISSVRTILASTVSASIRWNTELTSTSVVEIAQCSKAAAKTVFANGQYTTVDAHANGTSHQVSVGLNPNSTYTYRVFSAYAYDPQLIERSGFVTFSTYLTIGSVSATPSESGNSVTIKWKTNVGSNSWVHYGTADYASSMNGYDSTNHAVTVTGLISNQAYIYKVSSFDGYTTACSVGYGFRTVGLTVFKVASGQITTSSATITWTSRFTSSGYVEYGTTTNYGYSTSDNQNRAQHSVPLTGLQQSTAYHFRVHSASTTNGSDQASSGDYTFATSIGHDDAGSKADAGNTVSASMPIVSGTWKGNLTSGSDTKDFYKFYVFNGQKINISLVVPSGFNFDLYLYNHQDSNVASSTSGGTGAPEAIGFTSTAEGYYKVEARLTSGSGRGLYTLTLHLTDAMNTYTLDVGTTGDNYPYSHSPGLSLLNGTGWGSILSNPTHRDGTSGSAILLNVDSEQQTRDYLVTVRYYATSNVTVSVLGAAGNVNLTVMPGSTSWSSWSFVIGYQCIWDSNMTRGTNVKISFSAGLSLDTVIALAYSSTFDANNSNSAIDPPRDLPMVTLEQGWTTDGCPEDGAANATIIVSIPRTDIGYMLTLAYSDQNVTEVMQQYSSSTYKSIGRLAKFGQEAMIVLNKELYYDVNAALTGMDIRLKLVSPIKNLTWLSLLPIITCTNVGTTSDNGISANDPGASILLNGEWGSIANEQGRTYRNSTNGANFYLNSPIAGSVYTITLAYKTQSGNVKLRQCLGGSSYLDLGTLSGDNQWHETSFAVDPRYADQVGGSELNVMFELTGVAKIDWINVTSDTDGDGIPTYTEAARYYDLDTTYRSTDFSKTFTTWTCGNVTVRVDFVLPGWIYWQEISLPIPVGGLGCTIAIDGTVRAVVNAVRDTLEFSLPFSLTLAKGQHTISMSQFGGTMFEERRVLVTNTFDLNPKAADTDSDGMNDKQEITAGTNPCNPDTDNDGLLDGQESFSVVFSSDRFIRIPREGGSITYSNLALHAIPDHIAKVTAMVGIIHDHTGALTVYVESPTRTIRKLFADYFSTSSNLFEDFDLLKCGFSQNAFGTDGIWRLVVLSNEDGSENARIEYFKIQIDVSLDPLVSDCDHDGILDGEEVQLGADGWVTNPRSVDSDWDGLKDSNEIAGRTPCGVPTDPTSNDTDDDGCPDAKDLYMGDMVVRVTIENYKSLEDINFCSTHNIFFLVTVGGQTFSTKRAMRVTTGNLVTLNWIYDVDMPDDSTTADVVFSAVADNAGLGGYDIQLDICPVSGVKDCSYSFNIECGSSDISTAGAQDGGLFGDGDADAQVQFEMERQVKTRSTLIVINGSDDSGGYGLTEISDSDFRYSADQEVYVFNLDVSSGNGRFQTGMNTIIVPRCIALECILNATLENLDDISPTDPLYQAQFLYTNNTQQSSSAHVVVVITKNVTASQAEAILYDLTHNSSGGRIGNNVSISQENVYLLHLPRDVLAAVPSEMRNDGLDSGPNYFDPLRVITEIADFVFDCLIFVATIGFVLTYALIEFGMKVIGALVAAAAELIAAAVNVLVEAFVAFVNWVVSFALSVIDAIFSPIINAVRNLIDSYVQGVSGALSAIIDEIGAHGRVSSANVTRLSTAMTGPLFWVLFGVGVALSIVDIVLLPFTLTFGCLILTIAEIVVGIVVVNMLGGALVEAAEQATEWIWSSVASLIETLSSSGDHLRGCRTESHTASHEILMEALGCVFTTTGLIFGLGGWGMLDSETHSKEIERRLGLSKNSIICSVVGLTLGLAAMVAEDPVMSFLLGGTGIIFGVSSMMLEAESILGLKAGKCISDFVSITLGGIDVVCSGIACAEAADRM